MLGNSTNGLNAVKWVKNGSSKSFMADVVEASREVPVIVDFWAPWCGPCKQLGPMLERLVQAENGSVRMVKINVDENQELAAQMRVQSIPAVFAFANGQPVDGFMGALPESQLKQFISRLTAASAQAGDELAAMLQAAGQALSSGDLGLAGDLYSAALQANRENAEAIAGLAMVRLALDEPADASAILALCPPEKQNEAVILQAQAALALALNSGGESGSIADLQQATKLDPANLQARLDLALALGKAGRKEEAVDELIEVVKKDRNWNDGAGRKQLIQFFEAWGAKDPITLIGRRKLSAILFS